MKIAILHYSCAPIVGGVEAVISAHAKLFVQAGYSVTVIAGVGNKESLPTGAEFINIPEMSSKHPTVVKISEALDRGVQPQDFGEFSNAIADKLSPILSQYDCIMVHNLFSKHFNIPLTNALFNLLDDRLIRHCIAWIHDISWASPNSRSKLQNRYPWDLLCTHRPDVKYVVISNSQKHELINLLKWPEDNIKVIYDGIDPPSLLGLSEKGKALIERLDLWNSSPIIIMPIRITQAKNIESAFHVVAALKQMNTKPKLVITGPPDPHDTQSLQYFENLRDLKSKLGLDDEVKFIYENGPKPDQPFTIDTSIVNDLYRVSDLLFMPSLREGFGMPIIEAGFIGLPIISTEIPAAMEIGQNDISLMSKDQSPEEIAGRIRAMLDNNPLYRLRSYIRQNLTWKAIFDNDISTILKKDKKNATPNN